MKKFLFTFLLLCIICGINAKAQITVFSQNKCHFDKLSVILKMWKEELAPLLNAQVDAGKLSGWGILTHRWGDEWNFNVYYNAKNISEFESAFNEVIKKWEEKFPEGMKRVSEACFEHKDSYYNSAYQYPIPEEEN